MIYTQNKFNFVYIWGKKKHSSSINLVLSKNIPENSRDWKTGYLVEVKKKKNFFFQGIVRKAKISKI